MFELGEENRKASIPEVYHIMNEIKDRYQYNNSNRAIVFRETFEYVRELNQIENSKDLENLKKLLKEEFYLKGDDISSLLSLFPSTVVEVRALIPTLKYIDDEIIKQFLNQMKKIKK
ncbi:hypothetical protein A0H76_820 [Hepatospora eriocheir]|uniref:RPB4 n=1 Tax=Hepatospora eriocheir TaxID=1081669 RepID=A0A1X0QI65_9MICR|nr:hypothetical protein A0H76_820 [Hepatospora eriocheir]